MATSNADRSAPATGIPPLGVIGTLLVFGGGAILLFAATHGLIPLLASRTAAEPVLLWFIAGGLGTLVPLVVVGIVILRGETSRPLVVLWRDRLRFRRMNAGDWLWSFTALLLVGLFAAGMLAALRLAWPGIQLHPPFLKMDPLTPGRYWILAAWLPFFVLNILGEEFLWRGVVLPRQEAAFGKWTWLANGGGWLLFHLAFGPTILATLFPIVFILPFVVQRRKNSWIGVVIHGGLNGPGFLAVAFGFA
ncbi:MAG TPA: CPBP family intramembrane glutamic endopeptidase [Pirellulaceae bacterium]|nr:CPBP family intramembrane glutamic endopeptidase [Pirellulaceae bacterium]